MIYRCKRRTFVWIINTRWFLFSWLFFPFTLHASFIESTLGAAVINDATAAYYNPASLTQLKTVQIIALGTLASSRTHFTGESIQSITGFTQVGRSADQTHYVLPSVYLGVPTTNKATFGLAVVSNFFNRNIEEDSILRYVQSNNNTQDIDLVPALGFKLNEFVSLGAGVTLSYARFLSEPMSGLPSLNIPDAHSHNESNGHGLGANAGFLLTPSHSTVIGFNYRSSITYRLSGSSVLDGNPKVISNDYHFTFWTPARSVLSINQFVTDSLGFIGTVQRIQWSIFNEMNMYGIAAKIGSQPMIVNASVPYHLHDTWLFTVGNHYRITPKWIIRVAGNYNQAPDRGHYQISNGDSMTLGAAIGYEIHKNMIIDGSFAHVFTQNKNINILTGRNIIHGKNSAIQDSFSLKLTINR